MSLGPYDLKPVKIGEVLMYARPIEWDDLNLEDLKATKYETACPHCGQLVIFDSKFSSIKCPNCGVGEDKLDMMANEIVHEFKIEDVFAINPDDFNSEETVALNDDLDLIKETDQITNKEEIEIDKPKFKKKKIKKEEVAEPEHKIEIEQEHTEESKDVD